MLLLMMWANDERAENKSRSTRERNSIVNLLMLFVAGGRNHDIRERYRERAKYSDRRKSVNGDFEDNWFVKYILAMLALPVIGLSRSKLEAKSSSSLGSRVGAPYILWSFCHDPQTPSWLRCVFKPQDKEG